MLGQPIAVSTVWNALRHESGRSIIQELQSLGFTSFELNVHLTEGMLREIEGLLPDIEIATLHNYCPAPEGPRALSSGDLYLFSSLDPIERRKAVDATLRTVEWAQRLGAKAVVVHAGRVRMEHQDEQILDLRLAGHHEEADGILRRGLALREKIRGPHLDAALATLAELAERAAGGVLLGVETRVGYNEIPSFDEVASVLEVVPPSAGGYWHDFGHAHMLDLVGVARHEEFLARYAGRLVGMHIHNVSGKQDHRSLTEGTIDFARLAPLVPADALSVLEIHQPATADELVRSREIWRELQDGGWGTQNEK